MPIQFIAPFERAYYRMKSALFQPFDLHKWMVLGFTAFLADLLDHGGGGNSLKRGGHADWGAILGAPYEALDWLKARPQWMALIVLGGLLLLVILLLGIWLSSRGKFMFLDNVVQERALISQPWRQFRDLGHSLFRWRVAFLAVAILLAGGTLYHLWRIAYTRWNDSGDLWSLLPSLFIWGAFFAVVVLALGYVKLLLDHFIVPLMYKDNCTCVQAWEQLLPLHWRHLGYFILYALFMLAIIIALVVLVILGGLFTCCLGFFLLMIPYINSVVLLPFLYWIRAFSLEFLAQFGEAYTLLPQRPVEENALPQ
ncbi:MAG TPA: hypothetical protein PLG50_00170 [bacterium]|nr:hypothetical protein [bacterium]HQG44054.1 hypothetical protein [bacterium]HQI48791.1 hypothetical protein [bacterium]HQJ63562.1 hypothetical protein [bacterium]